ncbi:MAG: ribosome maturation factor RimP [Pseudomonadota bacterium]|nr:ribosome maturation factor RimP [Pseudomonadota bacterium]
MKLNALLEQTIPGLGYELVDIEIAPSKVVRIFIDKENGITIDDCERVSNHLTRLFMVEEIDFNRLEISSPGVERPLKKIEDFVRFTGKLAKIKTIELIGQDKVFVGIIKGVVGECIQLQVGEIITEIDFTNINRARLIFEYKRETNSKKTKKLKD